MHQLKSGESRVPTLAEVFEDFSRHRKLKSGTLVYYDRILTIYLRDWLPLPINGIGRDEVQERHTFITAACGPTSANVTMRILSAIFNYAIFRFRTPDNRPMLHENPVILLTQLRSWNKLKPKHRVIKKDQLPQWYKAVMATKSHNLRDSLLLMLFTGLRKSEAAQMTWKNVDFADRSFVIEDPKNGKDHVLPMSSYVFDLFTRRHKKRESEWVFPNRFNDGPMSTDTSTYERVGFKSGIVFSPHDLRRTMILIARTVKTDHYTLKQLLNHSGGNDVTFSCYTTRDIEILREPVERICQAMKFYLGISEPELQILEQRSPLIGRLEQ